MAFDLKTTALVFVGVIAAATLVVAQMPMTARTIYMMVVPSMVVFGLLMVLLGVKHGEHRASQ
ncbi:MAG: hypothetical protein R3185_06375 [Candidatus Thermoplasmatota archaeon]|nr:hypothetical protein [Candidatus Thermoplasmatota archaeon]